MVTRMTRCAKQEPAFCFTFRLATSIGGIYRAELFDERQADPRFLAGWVDWPRRLHPRFICSAGEAVFAIIGINRD